MPPSPPSKQSRPFRCTFCWRMSPGPPSVLGRRSSSSRLACAPCLRAVLDLAVCWVCGEVVFRGDECVSLGWAFWHRACYGCLFCGARRVVTAPGVKELFEFGTCRDDDDEDEEENGGGGGYNDDMNFGRGGGRGRGRAREILEIPMCVNCVVACEAEEKDGDGDGDGLVEKALARIDLADGGVSRLRREIRKIERGSSSSTAIAAAPTW
ncbi:hypothetical protein F5Y14DRAFT_461199 [Nemania sp. NC0429]|nr:hypothetical protein F5Y14DRAFT_461199 [Nemania sp. NC0429]